MYSASDFEKLWFLYKTEGEPKGISLSSFCASHTTFNSSTPQASQRCIAALQLPFTATASGRTDWQNLTPAKIYAKI